MAQLDRGNLTASVIDSISPQCDVSKKSKEFVVLYGTKINVLQISRSFFNVNTYMYLRAVYIHCHI